MKVVDVRQVEEEFDESIIIEVEVEHLGSCELAIADLVQAEHRSVEALAGGVPDIILLDLMMPEMDGFEVVSALQANPAWRNIPVVVVTALDISAEDRQRLNRGVEHIVSKNAASPADLLARIGALMGEIKSKARKDA